jgi:type II secretory pathway component PulM
LKGWSFIRKSRFIQKRFIWGLVGIMVSLLIYLFGIQPLVEATRKAEEEILLKRELLHRYETYLQNRKVVEEELGQTIKLYETAQQKLLTGETPQLGAANLQEIVKRLSEKNGISIRSFRILEPKEINSFRKIFIQIDFNPTNSMLSFGQFINDIEHYEKDLIISEMDLLVPNIRMPSNIQGNLVISGLMKGTQLREKGRVIK